MICPKCGARLAQGSTICPICGTKIRPSKVKVQDNYEEQPDQGYDSDSDDDYEENLNDDYDYDEEDDSYGNDDYDNDDYEPARPKTNRILVVIIVTVIALIVIGFACPCIDCCDDRIDCSSFQQWKKEQ